MKVIIKRANEQAKLEDIDNTLEAMQEVVKGNIQVVNFNKDALLICNEEGKVKDLMPNFGLCGDVICGDVFFCGAYGDDFTDIDKESAEMLIEFFNNLNIIRKKDRAL